MQKMELVRDRDHKQNIFRFLLIDDLNNLKLHVKRRGTHNIELLFISKYKEDQIP